MTRDELYVCWSQYGTCLSVVDSVLQFLYWYSITAHSQDFVLTITDAFSCLTYDLNVLDGNTGFTDGFPAVDVADKWDLFLFDTKFAVFCWHSVKFVSSSRRKSYDLWKKPSVREYAWNVGSPWPTSSQCFLRTNVRTARGGLLTPTGPCFCPCQFPRERTYVLTSEIHSFSSRISE